MEFTKNVFKLIIIFIIGIVWSIIVYRTGYIDGIKRGYNACTEDVMNYLKDN